MPTAVELAPLLALEASREKVQRDLDVLPLEQAFSLAFEALKLLSPADRQKALALSRAARTTGILEVADLRMPATPCFGPYNMPAGDALTDYDRARTFLLQKRRPGERIWGFYPEFTRYQPRERIINLADAHVGCAPGGQKQANLFSLCGKYDFPTATVKTQPGGTTCALFMRAVLRAADDTRMTDDKLPEQANMINAMGLEAKFSQVAPQSRYCWVDTVKDYDLQRGPLPMRGDLFFVILPGVLYPDSPGPHQDSGHVGFVSGDARIVRKKDDNLHFESIDGGVSKGADRGHWTVRGEQQLQRTGRGQWEIYNKQAIGGSNRILLGFVDLDRVLYSFHLSPQQLAAGTRWLSMRL